MSDSHESPVVKDCRILLLHPFNVEETYHYSVPQVALGYLTAALKQAGYYQIDIRDAQLERWNVNDVIEYVAKSQPDVIGLRVWSHQLNTVGAYLEGIKRVCPNVKIIAGGPHLTVAPQYVQMVPAVDFGIVGEAERSLPPLLDHIIGLPVDLTTIPGLARVENGVLLTNPMAKDPNLDSYEVDWDALQLDRYHRSNKRTTAYDHGTAKNAFIFTTRGCPYPCTYCAAGLINGKAIREHSGERMMRDIRKLYYEYGVRHFNIMDDNFTFYKDTVLEFCNSFLKYKSEFTGVTFHNPNGVRVDRLDDEMLALMKECGWKWLHIGVESASPNVLKKMKKMLKIELVQQNITKIKQHGLKCWGFFILGYPGETREDMETTINFTVESDLTAATYSLFSPIPGTGIYKTLVDEKKIPPDYNMTGYNSAKDWVFAEGMNGDDLQRMQRKALMRFYVRPDRAYYLIRDMDFSTFSNRVKTIFVEPLVRGIPKHITSLGRWMQPEPVGQRNLPAFRQ